MRSSLLSFSALVSLAVLGSSVGCSGTSPTDGSGGTSASGGNTNVGTGGTTGSGSGTGSGATGSGATGSGATGSGAGSGAGGTNSGGSGGFIPSECEQADLEVCGNEIGTHCGYTYEYWKDAGTGCLQNNADGFSVEWTNVSNLLGRKGVRPGTAQNVITYEADYEPDGNSYLCAYGWTTNPLVEYYIVESWDDEYRPPGGQGFKGTVTTDGGTYDIYRTERVNQPSIEGTATFPQFWSVRQQKREAGTITVGNHFAAWAEYDMDMGSLYEVSMCVEGYMSSGVADVKVHIE